MINEERWADHMWDTFIKREELESSPGVIDEDMIRALMLNTYLIHVREMIQDGSNRLPDFVSDHLEDVMTDIFLCYSHVVEGRDPDPDEISAHLELPENVEARKQWADICFNSDPDTWPETMERLREMLPDADLSRINWDSAERRKNAEKWEKRFAEKGYIEL